ncbi:hypothetical protein [Actinophytocola gossypii]|uniref:Antibiotic biosynthesis monooxygenase n=1 Tax=Actinophytocola gossypii TaxID=2812003 RepID=A0ABT2JCU8_9PSEU|nr:hypothetical protein [Actinophytocola gossypii]MCT2585601.1 hypothetical protein [Actinophytocola gossypii]
MTLAIVRFTTRPEQAKEVEESVADLFAAIHEESPTGIRYLATRHPDQPEFELLLHLADGTRNPLPAIPRAARFRERLAAWSLTDPAPKPLRVLNDYRMLG